VGRGRTVRLKITLGSGGLMEIGGPGRGRPILNVAGGEGRGGWVGGGIQWGPRLQVGVVSSGSGGHWLVLGQQHHTGHISWERRALSCGVVGLWKGGEWWGD